METTTQQTMRFLKNRCAALWEKTDLYEQGYTVLDIDTITDDFRQKHPRKILLVNPLS